jgi:thioredoxin reductase (NADPH)
MSVREILIIGGGPSGLAAAISAKQRGIDYLVLEQGVLVNSIFRFPPQMVFFTTPELLEIGGLPLVSPFDKPTRTEALRYYRRVVDTFGLHVTTGEKVTSVSLDEAHRGAERPVFAVESVNSRGRQQVRYAHHVIFAIGYYDHPVRLGIPGEDLPHVHHYYGEAHAHYRQRVVVVGGGNSAAEAALELYRSGAHVTMVHRRPTLKRTIKYWVRPDIENRIKEGSIAAHFSSQLIEIRPASVVVQTIPGATDDEVAREKEVVGDADASHEAASVIGDAAAVERKTTEVAADAVYLLTGYRADAELMRAAGIALNDRAAPVLNPETFESNVPGLFVAGGAIAGVDTGTVFIENGRFHGQKIVDTIAARLEQLA